MAGYKHPFAGQRAPGGKKASRPKQFRKQSKGAKGKRSSQGRSPWVMLAVGASFAAMWAFTIFKVQDDSKQRRKSDTAVLKSLLFKPLVYTEHAACRMDCRFISEDDVDESLKNGKINAHKSQPRLLPCPKYVVDAKVGEAQKRVQTVFAACPANTKVLTVIDQDTNWECYCP